MTDRSTDLSITAITAVRMNTIAYEQFASTSLGQKVESIPHVQEAANQSILDSPSLRIVQVLSQVTLLTKRKILAECSGFLNHLIPIDNDLRSRCDDSLILAGARRLDDSIVAQTLFLEAILEARVTSDGRQTRIDADFLNSFRWEFVRFEHQDPLSRWFDNRGSTAARRVEERFEHIANYLREVTTVEDLHLITTIVARNLAGTPEQRSALYAAILYQSLLRVLPTGNDNRIDSDELRALVNIGFRSIVHDATVRSDHRNSRAA